LRKPQIKRHRGLEPPTKTDPTYINSNAETWKSKAIVLPQKPTTPQ
jgi:hypothetical protein